MANKTNITSWYASARLAWLERTAQKNGTINRSDLTKTFRISNAQASADIQAYLAERPKSLTYNIKQKTYHWNPKTKLLFTKTPWKNFP